MELVYTLPFLLFVLKALLFASLFGVGCYFWNDAKLIAFCGGFSFAVAIVVYFVLLPEHGEVFALFVTLGILFLLLLAFFIAFENIPRFQARIVREGTGGRYVYNPEKRGES